MQWGHLNDQTAMWKRVKWATSQMADGHLRPVSNVDHKWPQWSLEISDVTWSQKSTKVVTDVQMYKFAKAEVTINLRFTFIVTIFDIFKLIIDCQVDHRPFETFTTAKFGGKHSFKVLTLPALHAVSSMLTFLDRI